MLLLALCVTLPGPSMLSGMTQKQAAEALHLKKFEEVRLQREADIKEWSVS